MFECKGVGRALTFKYEVVGRALTIDRMVWARSGSPACEGVGYYTCIQIYLIVQLKNVLAMSVVTFNLSLLVVSF